MVCDAKNSCINRLQISFAIKTTDYFCVNCKCKSVVGNFTLLDVKFVKLIN